MNGKSVYALKKRSGHPPFFRPDSRFPFVFILCVFILCVFILCDEHPPPASLTVLRSRFLPNERFVTRYCFQITTIPQFPQVHLR